MQAMQGRMWLSGSGSPGSSLTHPSCCFLRQGILLRFVSAAFTQVYKLVGTGDTLLGVTLRWTSIPLSGAKSGMGGVEGLAILLGMLHAKETRISSGHLGLWLVCAFTFLHVHIFVPYMQAIKNRNHKLFITMYYLLKTRSTQQQCMYNYCTYRWYLKNNTKIFFPVSTTLISCKFQIST